MKLLRRLNTGPLCYTVEDWAIRNSVTSFSIFFALVFIFSWLAQNEVDYPTDDKQTRTVCIIFAVIFSIPGFFYIVQFVGLFKEKIFLLQIWMYFAAISGVIYTVLFFIMGIILMANGDIVQGIVVMVLLGTILAGASYYSILINYSVICNIKDAQHIEDTPEVEGSDQLP